MTRMNVNSKDQANPSAQDLVAVSSMLPPQQQNGAKVQMLSASVPMDMSPSLNQLNSENGPMMGEGNPANSMGRTPSNPDISQIAMAQQGRGRGRGGRSTMGRAMGRMPPHRGGGGRIQGRGQGNIFQSNQQFQQQQGNLQFSGGGNSGLSTANVSGNNIPMNSASIGVPGRGRPPLRAPSVQQQQGRGRNLMQSAPAEATLAEEVLEEAAECLDYHTTSQAGIRCLAVAPPLRPGPGPAGGGSGGGHHTQMTHHGQVGPGPGGGSAGPGQQMKGPGGLNAPPGHPSLYQPQTQGFNASQPGSGQMAFPGGRAGPGGPGGPSGVGAGLAGGSAT
eukprot:CAMPEP_0117734406 /NCGR_PEP_ID=MMETSP0947-20121206/654_1 /TAXON_ID=44440 /ORGANISM="Chattonella subsalsa, Strain CCMP2191" /LENGTH=333 /DNA_ID=CAMNT_0005549177 /DNA_START=128 /DNA_END=1127 /DNA_ORIENTATION=-